MLPAPGAAVAGMELADFGEDRRCRVAACSYQPGPAGEEFLHHPLAERVGLVAACFEGGAELKVRPDDPAAASIVARLQVFADTLRAQSWPGCVFDLRDEATALG